MKKLNYPLIIGVFTIIILLLVSMYPESFSKSDPYGKQRIEFVSDESGNKILTPPFPPSVEYVWGTDHTGRDLKSLIVYGCKTTMLLALTIALGRLLISLPLAIAAAYKNKFAIWIIKQFNVLFSAFPVIVLVLLLARIKLFRDLYTSEWGAIGILLIVLGWSKLAYMLMEKVKEVLGQDFIEGETAIGKTKLEIALQNIIPHIIPSIIVLFFLEVALVLLVMAQIGIFSIVFTGGYYSGDFDELRVPYQFDWPNLLSLSHIHLMSGRYWLLLYPVIAFALSIIGFNMFGEGLRIEFDKRNSRVISFLRKIPNLLSPLRLVYEIKHIKEHRGTVYKKALTLFLIFTMIVFPQAKSEYRFDESDAIAHLNEICSEKYEGRLAGSKTNKDLAEYIASKLEEYGVEPIDGEYLHEYDIVESFNMYYSELSIDSDNKDSFELEYRNDYIVTSGIPVNGIFDLVYLRPVDLANRRATIDHEYKDKVILIDTRGMSPTDFIEVRNRLNWNIRPKGIIFIENWLSRDDYFKYPRVNKFFKHSFVIMMSSNKGSELIALENPQITINTNALAFDDSKGYNVAGYIKGTDESEEAECIVIGSGFDYIGNDFDKSYPGATSAGAVAMELEIARVIKESGIKPEKTIVFAFWDGVYTSDRGSRTFVNEHLSSLKRNYFYIDLKNLIGKKTEGILIDTSKIIPKNEWAQENIKAIKKNAKRNGINLIFGTVFSQAREDFKTPNQSIVIIDSMETEGKALTPYDDVSNIDNKKFKAVGQMLLDTLFEISSQE